MPDAASYENAATSALAAAAAATSDARWRAHARLQLGTASPGELREALSAETDPELRGRLLRGLVDAGDGGARDELAQLTMLQSGPAEVLALLDACLFTLNRCLRPQRLQHLGKRLGGIRWY